MFVLHTFLFNTLYCGLPISMQQNKDSNEAALNLLHKCIYFYRSEQILFTDDAFEGNKITKHYMHYVRASA